MVFQAARTGRRREKNTRRIVLGTAEELKSLASARNMVVGIKREINANNVRLKNNLLLLRIWQSTISNVSLPIRHPGSLSRRVLLP